MTSQRVPRPFILVVGVDFGEQSERALVVAANLARRSAPSIVHVVYAIPPIAAPERAVDYAQMCKDGKVQLEGLVKRLDMRVPVNIHVVIGAPVDVLTDVATNLGADVLVTGTHGRRGVARLAFGSVAETLVRRAPCSVVVVRDRTPTADEKIEPPCPDCVARAQATSGAELWCVRHSEHHVRAHTYHEDPSGADFGMGSQSFRQSDG